MALPTRHFKIGFNSYLVLGQAKNEDMLVYDGTAGLFKFVVEGMKFSYDYVVESRRVRQLPNGAWTGVLGLLNRSEIDYAPAALMLTEEGWDGVAYNYPYAIDELVFLTEKRPLIGEKLELSPNIMALFRTLSLNVWLSLLACIILVTLACFVVMKHRCTLDDVLLHVLAIALNQEGNLVPKRVGEIMLLCTWLVGMAVFTFCFKSVLLSFLAFPPQISVGTVPELAAAIRAGQYIVDAPYSNDFARYLQRSTVDDLRVIGDSLRENTRGTRNFLSFANVKRLNKAYVYSRSRAPLGNDEWYLSEDNMGSLYFATAVSKKFCCKDEMDMFVLRFLAAGIDQKIDRWRHFKNLYYGFESEFTDDGEITRKITLTDISGALIILVSGQCLSVFVLIIECWVKRRQRRRTVDREQ